MFRSLWSFLKGAEEAGAREGGETTRRWRLWQVEPSFSCNLDCVMCPWRTIRKSRSTGLHMAPSVWDSLRPWLGDVGSVDFTGGGEPLLQQNLFDWIDEVKAAGGTAGFLTNGLLLDSGTLPRLLDSGTDWVGFSVDGADSEAYERIRRGSDFRLVSSNIRALTARRVGDRPLVMINFVIMNSNIHQLSDIVRLAADLGVDQVNFKQCDVIRGADGKGTGVFGREMSRTVKRARKELKKACRLAARLGLATTSFRFTPKEQPVCDQDPRDALYIRYDGRVSPCINLALGGESEFFGEKVVFPELQYGTLPDDSIEKMWESERCRTFRSIFERRSATFEHSLSAAEFGRDLVAFERALEHARRAMEEPPVGCRNCHYLFGV